MTLVKGKFNCITDVPGVKVGHVTLYEQLNEQETICTGVTAILPHDRNLFQEKVRAATDIVNGFGKSVGLFQIDELGLLESPIMLTNTLSVGPVLEGTLTHMLDMDETIGDSTGSINVVVGECNDSYLNSMRLRVIQPTHAIEAIEKAKSGGIEQGAVGAGKGMVCFNYKGGIGTASRIIKENDHEYTVGALVLSNFGKREDALFANFPAKDLSTPDGSIMMVIATDAPASDRQLKRLARRCAAGLARTGSYYAHGSGDISIAFSTTNLYSHTERSAVETVEYLRDDHPIMNQLFLGVTKAIEEAIINSLNYAETTVGRQGRVIHKAPL